MGDEGREDSEGPGEPDGESPDGQTPAEESGTSPAGPSRAVVLAVTALVLLASYLFKSRCIGPRFDAKGRSVPDWFLRSSRDLCYSGTQDLWGARDLGRHIFPYVHAELIEPGGRLVRGGIEYPVLTGLAMWLAALPAATDATYVAVAAVMVTPMALLVSDLLRRLAGRRVWWWVLTPPLFLYAFFNWDLPPVACTMAAVAVMVLAPAEWSRRRTTALAAVLLGVGAGFKWYPLLFALPLALWVAVGPARSGSGRAVPMRGSARRDLAGFLLVGVAAVGTFLLINLPFAVAGTEGWWASFEFQGRRPTDVTTNSIWFWSLRPLSDATNPTGQRLIGVLSASATAGAVMFVCAIGLGQSRNGREYPWLQVSASLLCVFLLFNKVHSPQFALWLAPFFVVLRIRPGWIAAYCAADLAMFLGFFRWQYLIQSGEPFGLLDGWPSQALVIGVWGRAVLLVAIGVAFLRAPMVRSMPERRGPNQIDY